MPMVTFFTITLIISIAGIAALMTIKQIELSTGMVVLGPLKRPINRFFRTILVLIERVLPALARESLAHVLETSRTALLKLVARGILWFETLLHDTLRLLREKLHPHHTRGEASAFLKEVGEYKKQLESKSETSKEEQALY